MNEPIITICHELRCVMINFILYTWVRMGEKSLSQCNIKENPDSIAGGGERMGYSKMDVEHHLGNNI